MTTIRLIGRTGWLALVAAAILGLGAGPAAAAGACGDTSGPGGTDVPCSCGDTVTSDTRLDATDPVLHQTCRAHGLAIGGPVNVLEINGTLRGSGRGHGLAAQPLKGGFTVKNGRIEGFRIGFHGDDIAHVRLENLSIVGNTLHGIVITESHAIVIERSSVSRNGGSGMILEGGIDVRRTRVVRNHGAGMIVRSDDDVGDGTGGRIVRNLVAANGGDGILVACFRCKVVQNRVLGNGGFGIVDGSDVITGTTTGDNLFRGNRCFRSDGRFRPHNGVAASFPFGRC